MKKKNKSKLVDENKSMNKDTKIIAIILLSITILTFLWVMFIDNKLLNNLYLKNDSFMDFYNHIFFSRCNYNIYTYSIHVVFPPIMYCLYYLFSLFIPLESLISSPLIFKSDEGIMLFLFYMIILTTLFITIFQKCLKSENKNLLIVALLLSGPMIYAYQRGNIIILAMLFLVLFVHYYYSESKSKNLAYLFLSLAVCCKIYPIFFGILLLKEKDYKGILKCIIITSILFFVPFIFFGGMDGFAQMVNNIKNLNNPDIVNQGISLSSLFHYSNKIALFLNIVLFITTIVSLFVVKQRWKLALIATILCAFIPHWSGYYVLIYFFVPLIMYLNENNNKKIDKVYILLITLLLSTSICFYPPIKNQALIILIIFVLLFVEIFNSLINEDN